MLQVRCKGYLSLTRMVLQSCLVDMVCESGSAAERIYRFTWAFCFLHVLEVDGQMSAQLLAYPSL